MKSASPPSWTHLSYLGKRCWKKEGRDREEDTIEKRKRKKGDSENDTIPGNEGRVDPRRIARSWRW